ncbi:hypothetical protein [Xanthomonas sp. 4461]|uniref:hypothetical protein n=1 Tax=Xanthomonas sp. 4461 TaxID=3035313 RepID=UPI0021670B61|nr:hypothetical protein [Xanthomonas sp. 4461]MCS3810161.1 hypothetical protein [Xanthomonas sp. 4461]
MDAATARPRMDVQRKPQAASRKRIALVTQACFGPPNTPSLLITGRKECSANAM